MKKKALCIAWLLAVGILSGCSRQASVSDKTGTTVAETVEKKAAEDGASGETAQMEYIHIETDIKELEAGFSVVRYEGDYGLDEFIEQGGAKSDAEVLKFLTGTLLGDAVNISFRTEPFGCSTISVENTEGGYYFGRNFDWNKCNAMVVASYPQNGYASFSTVNVDFIKQGAGIAAGFVSDDILTQAALYAPLDGMNEKGLCVSVNMIQDSETISQNSEKPDITTTTAIRLLLDKAASVDEAVDILRQYDFHASMDYMVHLAIADSTGKSVAVEYINNEMVVTETPILTNFYLADGEKQGIGTEQSHTRFEMLEKAIERNAAMDSGQVRDTLSGVSKKNFGEFESTEWSIVFNQKTLSATYYHREDYDKSYAFLLFDK